MSKGQRNRAHRPGHAYGQQRRKGALRGEAPEPERPEVEGNDGIVDYALDGPPEARTVLALLGLFSPVTERIANELARIGEEAGAVEIIPRVVTRAWEDYDDEHDVEVLREALRIVAERLRMLHACSVEVVR